MVNATFCTVEFWMLLGGLQLVSTQELEVRVWFIDVITERAQWEWAPTHFWLWLGKYSYYVMKHYLMNSNIFCLGFPFLQLGWKKKHEKRCEIGKSVLRLHFLRVRNSSSLCEKKRNGDIFLISETSVLTRSCGYLQRHLLGCHPWRNCKWTLHKNVMNNRLELS